MMIIQQGMKFVYKESSEQHLLTTFCSCDDSGLQAILTNISTGLAFSNAVRITNPNKITRDEWHVLCNRKPQVFKHLDGSLIDFPKDINDYSTPDYVWFINQLFVNNIITFENLDKLDDVGEEIKKSVIDYCGLIDGGLK